MVTANATKRLHTESRYKESQPGRLIAHVREMIGLILIVFQCISHASTTGSSALLPLQIRTALLKLLGFLLCSQLSSTSCLSCGVDLKHQSTHAACLIDGLHLFAPRHKAVGRLVCFSTALPQDIVDEARGTTR